MRPSLDENLSRRPKQDFAEHEIFTVRDKGWNGIQNGELLSLMLAAGFQALLTFDKNLQHQQNFKKCIWGLRTCLPLQAPAGRHVNSKTSVR